MESDIKNKVQHILLDKKLSIRKLAELLKDKYGDRGTPQNLWSKLNKGTIRYQEVVEILDILEYDITWIKR